MANKPHIRVQNLHDLQNFLARLLNRVERGEVSTEKGKTLASISRVLMDCIAREQEKQVLQRLEELEKLSGIAQ